MTVKERIMKALSNAHYNTDPPFTVRQQHNVSIAFFCKLIPIYHATNICICNLKIWLPHTNRIAAKCNIHPCHFL